MVFFIKKRLFSIIVCFLSMTVLTVAYSQENHELNSLFNEFNKSVLNNFPKAKQLAIKGLYLSKKTGDSGYIFQSYINLIKIYTLDRDFNKVKLYGKEGFLIQKKIEDNALKVDFYNAISYSETLGFNFNKALKFSERAISVSSKINDSLKISESFVNSANLLIDRQEEEEAETRLKRILDIGLRQKYYGVLSEAYSSLAEINYIKEKDSAIHYYNQALKYAHLDNNKYKQGALYAELAFFHRYHLDLDKVLSLIEKAKIISEEVGSKYTLHIIYYTLGSYYEEIEQYDLSIKYYKKSISDYGNYAGPVQLSNAYIMTSSALSHNNEFEEAYQYQEKYLILSDSLFNLKKTKEFDVLRTEYEVEKKNSQISLLEKENEIKATKQKWIITSAIILLLPLLMLFLFYRQRAKNQIAIRSKEKALHLNEKERLEKEQELIEIKALVDGQDKERDRIAKELHDGVGGKLASVNLSLSHINSNLKDVQLEGVSKSLVDTLSF